MTGTGAYAIAKSEQSGEKIDGAALAVTLEGMRGANVSLGLSLAYASLDGETTEAGEVTQRRVSSMPAYLLVRYWFGDPEGTVRGYIGVGPGVYISFLDTTTLPDNKQTTVGSSGFALAIPAGFVYSVTERIFLNFSYSFNWLADNDYLENGIVNTFGLGLGFMLSN